MSDAKIQLEIPDSLPDLRTASTRTETSPETTSTHDTAQPITDDPTTSSQDTAQPITDDQTTSSQETGQPITDDLTARRLSEQPRDSDQTLSPLPDSHQTFRPLRDSHQTLSPLRDSHETLRPLRDSHQTFRPLWDSEQTLRPSRVYDQTLRHGTFTWPDGASYAGEYHENARCGTGTQIWPDGSQYTGDFVSDARHGVGTHRWSNGESYSGDYHRDRRHGLGTYTWPDGRTYTGPFYTDARHGYGRFTFADGRVFEGLYKDDERDGPGVMTYPDGYHGNATDDGNHGNGQDDGNHGNGQDDGNHGNGQDDGNHGNHKSSRRQDVGMWRRERLIKLCTEISDCFSVDDQATDGENPQQNDQSQNEEKNEEKKASKNEENKVAQSALEIADELENPSDDEDIDIDVDDREFAKAFFEKISKLKSNSESKLIVKCTKDCTPLQKHMTTHQPYAMTTLSLDDIISCNRSHFGARGPLEELSENLIKASMNNEFDEVDKILKDGRIHADVADSKGRASLLGASTSWNQKIINALLDHGADINKLSDEGVTPLTACCSLFYPESRFKQNWAYMDDTKKNEKVIKTKRTKDTTEDQNQQLQLSPTPSIEGGINRTSDFASNVSLLNFRISVNSKMRDQCITELSKNQMVMDSYHSPEQEDDKSVRQLAVIKFQFRLMEETIYLLLKRGADPNATEVPMAALHYALKAADVAMVRELLKRGATCNTPLPEHLGGLFPVHLAAGAGGTDGVELTKLILDSDGDPNSRATPDKSYLGKNEVYASDAMSEYSKSLQGGRAPLHIACHRPRDQENATEIVKTLLDHDADPDIMCNGQSPLSLAIASGNDSAVDELLQDGADPSLELTHGFGSALAVASSIESETKRTLPQRINLIDKLMDAGADILAKLPVGTKRTMGTAVDHAHYTHNQDKRIANMPYHALKPKERELVSERRELLAYVGSRLRKKAMQGEEKQKLTEKPKPKSKKQIRRPKSAGGKEPQGNAGISNLPPDSQTLENGASILPPNSETLATKQQKVRPKSHKRQKSGVTFKGEGEGTIARALLKDITRPAPFKYCYECGRSINVHLKACSRCKAVFYCSKVCRQKAWNLRHKDECVKIEEKQCKKQRFLAVKDTKDMKKQKNFDHLLSKGESPKFVPYTENYSFN